MVAQKTLQGSLKFSPFGMLGMFSQTPGNPSKRKGASTFFRWPTFLASHLTEEDLEHPRLGRELGPDEAKDLNAEDVLGHAELELAAVQTGDPQLQHAHGRAQELLL